MGVTRVHVDTVDTKRQKTQFWAFCMRIGLFGNMGIF